MDKDDVLARHMATFTRNGWSHGADCLCKNIDRYVLPGSQRDQPDVRRLLPVETPDLNGEGIVNREMKQIIEDQL